MGTIPTQNSMIAMKESGAKDRATWWSVKREKDFFVMRLSLNGGHVFYDVRVLVRDGVSFCTFGGVWPAGIVGAFIPP